MIRVLISLLAGIPFMLLSCHHETVVPDYQVSYSNDVSPIIIGSCAQVHCHDATGLEAAPLANYFDVMNDVVKGKPCKSKLYTALITHSAKKMMPPPSSAQLTDQQIQLIYTWIVQGAPDN